MLLLVQRKKIKRAQNLYGVKECQDKLQMETKLDFSKKRKSIKITTKQGNSYISISYL